ncbi:MAG: hypothetical protein HYS86_02735, partial [Candidatus Chisholmbacteria bacterium]|nr:hypothetical protein [Candidatus Chisholmbacteria bacterium]
MTFALTPRQFLLRLLFPFILLLLSVTTVFSQEASPSAEAPPPTDITYPIENLDGCLDKPSCTTYCEDPVHYAACTQFAKEHSFYQDDPLLSATDDFWQSAQNELGCNSTQSCYDFCSDEANFAACDSYAKRNAIPGGYVDEPDNPEYLDVAQEVLGCNTLETCATFCDNLSNSDACGEFADRVGLLGGETTSGPGGCTTAETCGAYCSDPNNFSACSTFIPDGQTFTGPGGCTDEASCHSFCDQNPKECRSYAPGSNGQYVPLSCPAGQYYGPGGACTPNELSNEAAQCVGPGNFWGGNACLTEFSDVPVGIDPLVLDAHFAARPDMGGCTNPGECYDYCSANPDSCPGFDPGSPRPSDTYEPYLYYTPGTDVTLDPIPELGDCDTPGSCYDYCSANPDSCPGFDPDSPSPRGVIGTKLNTFICKPCSWALCLG